MVKNILELCQIEYRHYQTLQTKSSHLLFKLPKNWYDNILVSNQNTPKCLIAGASDSELIGRPAGRMAAPTWLQSAQAEAQPQGSWDFGIGTVALEKISARGSWETKRRVCLHPNLASMDEIGENRQSLESDGFPS